jgi:DivIVA domain-containing protein
MTHEPPPERLELQNTQPHDVVRTDDLAGRAEGAPGEATSGMDDATTGSEREPDPMAGARADGEPEEEVSGEVEPDGLQETRPFDSVAASDETRPFDSLGAGDALVATGAAIERVDAGEPELDDDIEALRNIDFPLSFRGYDPRAVDEYVAAVERCIARFDEARSPSAAVRRALDRVGEQTAAILQEAEKAAEETTRRSRAQADDRLQRAEQEAAATWAAAQARVRSLDEDIERLWEERQRLIDATRDLSRSLSAIADDAEARFPPEEDSGAPGTRPSRNGSAPVDDGPGIDPARDSLLDP